MKLSSSIILTTCLLVEIHVASSFIPQYCLSATRSRSFTSLMADPLANEGDWSAYLDEENTGLVYYFNRRTGESLWTAPTASFPDVYLTPRQRMAVQAKQKEYKESIAMKAALSESEVVETATKRGKKALFDFLKDKNDAVATSSPVTKIKGEWFDGIFTLKEDIVSTQKFEVIEEPGKDETDVVASSSTGTKTKGDWFDRIFTTKEEIVVAQQFEVVEESGEGKNNAVAASSTVEEKRRDWFDILFSTKVDPVNTKESAQAKDSVQANELITDALSSTEWEVKDQVTAAMPSALMRNFFGGATKKVEPTFESTEFVEDPKANLDAVPELDTALPKFGFGDFMTALLPKAEEGIIEAKPEQRPKTIGRDMTKLPSNVKAETKREKEGKSLSVSIDTTIKIDMSAYVLPHPDKVRWGGEDAVFTKGRTFGVFDGVSGADKVDGVPLYSNTLAKQMRTLVGEKALSTKELTALLTRAAEYADKSATGASTALIASVSEDGKLSVLNVGDSYCYVIRDGKVITKTKEIVHYFECPFQLSEDSPDRPKDGTKLITSVLPGDTILMGSDGVFDNLSDELILETVAAAPKRASTIAKKIGDLSRTVSLNDFAVTPFAKLAKRNGFEEYESGLGGKLDDVSCVVVRCT